MATVPRAMGLRRLGAGQLDLAPEFSWAARGFGRWLSGGFSAARLAGVRRSGLQCVLKRSLFDSARISAPLWHARYPLAALSSVIFL